jgi:hypothetical protein
LVFIATQIVAFDRDFELAVSLGILDHHESWTGLKRL